VSEQRLPIDPVSVVIAAHDAAGTLGETLASLAAQTFPGWEAVVVDDGSTDGTAALVARWAARERRVRLVRRPRGGVSAARNAGIDVAGHGWLLFLDADDWLHPEHLSRLVRAAAADPRLDVVHCGSVRVTPDGRRRRPDFAPPLDDPFAVLGRFCAFAIHACIVRRALVEAVGRFDPALATHEDWDLWQRLARAGARFGGVPEVLAFYRMRPKSASTDAERGLADGLRVLRRTHAADPRVPAPRPEYAVGLPADGLPDLLFLMAAWSAGLVLGEGGDPRPLLRLLEGERAPRLDPSDVAACLFDGALVPGCRTEDEWGDLWPLAERWLGPFLAALEARAGAPGLASATRRRLARRALDHVPARDGLTIGDTHTVHVDAERALADIVVPEGADRVRCVVRASGREVGAVEVPAYGRAVAAQAVAEAVAADLAWPLLRARLARGLHRDPKLPRRLAALLLDARTVRLALAGMRGRARGRQGVKGRDLARDVARRLVLEQVLLRAAPAGPAARAAAAWAAAVIEAEREAADGVVVGPARPGPTADVRAGAVAGRLPILAYHRIAADGPASLRRYRVPPERLEAQLAYLHSRGYRGVTLDVWRAALAARTPLPDAAVALTFDDGYRDFLTEAWPLLRRYGFPATVFLVSDAVGGAAAWDAAHGEPAPLLSWPEVRRLRDEGVAFASHGASHRALVDLSVEEALREGARAKARLERVLGDPVTTVAYPYGEHDAVVRRVMAACGYEYGLTCEERVSRLGDDPMALPRLAVDGEDDLPAFAAKVAAAGG
jgi:peptidoglycan/xylan/chitin deacetylase (PgdA/CDA1 family)/GT2 family glycosyltransferase